LLPQSAAHNTDDALKAIEDEPVVKTLGFYWHSRQDAFRFNAQDQQSLTDLVMKRTILSTIACLFDPLSWLSPVTITAKIIMQGVCILKCDWDASLFPDMVRRWRDYCESLAALPNISIDRWFGTTESPTMELHGFCDAFTRAYAAAVYLRIVDITGSTDVCLIASKSKVAPIKTVSIPNLELCGAVLLVKLARHLKKLPLFDRLQLCLWTDSQIVLAWFNKHPSHWKTFVAK
jgi:hypothetical protein